MNLLRIAGLIVAMMAAAALLAACGDDDEEEDNGGEATATEAASPDGGEEVTLELTAENLQYDKDTLEATAAAAVSLTLDNKDSVQHNFSLYESEDSDEPLFEGPASQGPETITYEFAAPAEAGAYHFHCDFHPTAMLGDFIVE